MRSIFGYSLQLCAGDGTVVHLYGLCPACVFMFSDVESA
jgi:hypothetical protein